MALQRKEEKISEDQILCVRFRSSGPIVKAAIQRGCHVGGPHDVKKSWRLHTKVETDLPKGIRRHILWFLSIPFPFTFNSFNVHAT